MPILSKLLDHLPYIGKLRSQIRAMRALMGRYPAGSYYSPIPSESDVHRHIQQRDAVFSNGNPGVDLQTEAQFLLLKKYSQYYSELPWSDEPQENLRYYFGQEWFCYADAIFLYGYLRRTEPKRIIEVGSGFSSSVILDTVQHFLTTQTEVTFIEPNPERLLNLLHPDDLQYVTLVEDIVQNVPLQMFSELQAGDLLFIDSSHVVKAGSDLYFLFFEILPQLPPGVTVHFHDIFYPFEYKSDWLMMGRYWNEAYFLRAFLSYNSKWRIRFFNSYVGEEFQNYLVQHMPLCLKNTGGSIYIERIES